MSSMMASMKKQILATQIAAALVAELSFPKPMTVGIKANMVKKLMDEPPNRADLGFQKAKNPNSALNTAAKSEGSKGIADYSDEEEANDLLCVACQKFADIVNTDIEHGVSFATFQRRQKLFLEFLNEDHEFSKHFLDANNITDFFNKDDKGIIKGTKYFYTICYNNASNLWLLCHGCNIKKGNSDFLKWFAEEKSFGDAFIKDVKEAGGMLSGVIFDHVGGQHIATIETKSKQKLNFHSGGIGIGKYAKDWYLEKYKKEIALQKELHTGTVQVFRRTLEEIKAGHIENTEEKFQAVKKNVLASNAVIKTEHSEDSSTVSDTDSRADDKAEHFQEFNRNLQKNSHNLKKLEQLFKELYAECLHEEIHDFISKTIDRVSANIESQKIDKFRTHMEGFVSITVLPMWQMVKDQFKHLKTPQEEYEIAQAEAQDALNQKIEMEKIVRELKQQIRMLEKPSAGLTS